MKQMGREAVEQVAGFLRAEARPLEQALFRWKFEGAPPADVRDSLAAFQNPDGGFGHALEPDVRTPTSSALATAIALRTLAEIGSTIDDPMAHGAITYLLATFDDDLEAWRVVPRDTNDHPHAPWWHDEDGSLARTFDDFRLIPRALIVGLLHRYRDLVSAEWLRGLTEAVVRIIEDVPVLGEGGGSDLEYVVYLAEAEPLPPRFKDRLIRRIRRAVPEVVVRDPTKWSSYCLTPLRAASRPSALGADLIADVLDEHLDYVIEQRPRGGDGVWEPTWSWGGQDPGSWARARREWKGILALQTLTALDAFGRMGTFP